MRDAEDLFAARGVVVSHETIRNWVTKFGQTYARKIRYDRPAPNDKWHLDEVGIRISGIKYWLWCAVDGNGDVLDISVQSQCDKQAAKRLFRKLSVN